MGRDGVVVEAASPVWVHHEDLALGVAHGDAVRVGARAAADAYYLTHSFGEEDAGCEALHAAHAGADGGVELGDVEGVEEAELGAHHVVQGEDGEPGGVAFAVGRVDGGRARGAKTASDYICADDEVFIRIQRGAGTDEPLPPAGLGVCFCAVGVA